MKAGRGARPSGLRHFTATWRPSDSSRGPPHLAHAAPPDLVEQPVPAVDQPGVPHLPRPPPSIPLRPPRLVQYGDLSAEFVRCRASSRGPRRAMARRMCLGGSCQRRRAGTQRSRVPVATQSAGDGRRFRGRPAVQLVGVRRQGGVRQMCHTPPQHVARRDQEGVRRRAEQEVVHRACLGLRRRGRAAPSRSRRSTRPGSPVRRRGRDPPDGHWPGARRCTGRPARR
ncbi:hypothetical protein SALBM311S_03242 [Streptomyces alboniger]